eukprot:CAMPEP_0116944820 /NCGR_PEP_ID=MMETSP0467-20121206/35994_1 /TAXON_ID=283647 /ORGANISM="Mesodinium pulex, Strain SPMC105" /LENGTH=100 /DNA_ID=CAMNT_0004628233 /DNA_START=220 /DNA_END=522 /DNA_ORIENTATION=-
MTPIRQSKNKTYIASRRTVAVSFKSMTRCMSPSTSLWNKNLLLGMIGDQLNDLSLPVVLMPTVKLITRPCVNPSPDNVYGIHICMFKLLLEQPVPTNYSY